MISFPEIKSRIQFIQKVNDVELCMLREDEIHPQISGNKFRKLKYNLEAFYKGNFESVLTFGGAYSNHIHAVASAGMEFGIQTIGIIRGEELVNKIDENPTLSFARDAGMELHFISRENYRRKNEEGFIKDLKSQFANSYILPEGGTNLSAIKGCEEILNEFTDEFNVITCAIGTGGTIAGILNSSKTHQKIIGFPSLKGADFLQDEIKKWSLRSNYELMTQFHFGGYGKVNAELLDFINDFKTRFDVTLDPIYTGKMMSGLMKLINDGFFPKGTKVLAIHTGGLQGIDSMNQKLIKSNKTIIK